MSRLAFIWTRPIWAKCRDCKWTTLFITVRPNSGASKRGKLTNQLPAATTEPLGIWQKMAVLFRSECHNVACLTNKNHLAWFPKHTTFFFALDACCKIHQSFSRVERMCFDVTSHCYNAAYAEVPLRSADMRSLWAEQKNMIISMVRELSNIWRLNCQIHLKTCVADTLTICSRIACSNLSSLWLTSLKQFLSSFWVL